MEITLDQIDNNSEEGQTLEKRRLELERKLLRPVYAYSFLTPNGNADLFLKHPDRYVLGEVIAAYQQGRFSMANSLLEDTCLLKEESDPRFYEEAVTISQFAEYDAVRNAMLFVLPNLVTAFTLIQKKS